MTVRWSLQAADDLEHIVSYISQDNPIAARQVGRTLYDGVGRLKDHPHSGRPGRVEGTREMVYPRLPYIAVYEVRDQVVEILTVLHGRQRWP
jgi:toxin ParE1/3/4